MEFEGSQVKSTSDHPVAALQEELKIAASVKYTVCSKAGWLCPDPRKLRRSEYRIWDQSESTSISHSHLVIERVTHYVCYK